MENKYKKGDWVRLSTEKPRYGARYVSTPVKLVKRTNDYLVEAYYPVEGIFQNIHTGDLEPWQPKVGERVRVPVTTNTEWVGEGEVVRVPGWCVIIKMLTGGMKGAKGGFYAHQIEPVTDTLPVAEQPAALTIQAGRYYKTRDGRKVGPMVDDYSFDCVAFIEKSGDGRGWSKFGVGLGLAVGDDLIAEWQEPVSDITAATVDAINDEYGPVVLELPACKPKFKVGDRVVATRTYADITAGTEYEVVEVDEYDEGMPVRVVDNVGDRYWLYDDAFRIVAPATTAIVCKIDNGQPLPASRPAVHATVEAADAEAKRLANLHAGHEFGVYALTGATHKVARVYEHEWQRLAADGHDNAAAAKLMKLAVIGAGPAVTAVRSFIAAA